MLELPVIHPSLLGALARAGHGSTVLIADGNYPHATGAPPGVERIHLNFSPGLLTVSQVLEGVRQILPIEHARVMASADGAPAPVVAEYDAALGMEPEVLERFAFYAAARADDLAVLIATADERPCANLLLTVGVRS